VGKDAPAWHERRGVLVPVVAVVAFLLGLGAGALGSGAPDEGTARNESVDSDREADLEVERDALAAQAEEQEREIAALRQELDAAEGEGAAPVEPEPEPAPEPAEGADDTATAGAYEFRDIQVREDFVGDFELRTRVTNTGETRESVSWTATLFSGGSVAASLSGFAGTFESGETLTVTFTGIDEFGEWDDVEFQVDFEF
jgi:hypothetical protein